MIKTFYLPNISDQRQLSKSAWSTTQRQMSCHSDFSHLLFFLHLPTLFVCVRDQTDIVSLNSIKKFYRTNELLFNYYTISPSLTSICEYFPRSYFDPPKYVNLHHFFDCHESHIYTLCCKILQCANMG